MSSPNFPILNGVELDKIHLRAARLLAEGWHTQTQISRKLKIDRKTLHNWERDPDFVAQVNEYRQEYRERIRQEGIAIVENRIKAVRDRWKIMQAMFKKTYGRGGTGDKFDASLLKELREHEMQVARELGQLDQTPRQTADAYVEADTPVDAPAIPPGAIPPVARPEAIQDCEGGPTIGQDGNQQAKAGDEPMGHLPTEPESPPAPVE